MNINILAKCLSQLSNINSLKIVKLLYKVGTSGLTIAEIENSIKTPLSTFLHNMDNLCRLKLITRKRKGKIVYYTAHYPTLDAIVNDLEYKCCNT